MNPKLFFDQNRQTFFDDREAAAEYVRANCRKELDKVLRTADLAAENKFVFQLRWDMEQTHVPEVFDGPIDWLRQPGDDPEFVYAFNRMRFWSCLGQAYAVTGDEKYAKAFAEQLVHWVDTVRRDDPACAPAWRSIEAGIRMENWCKAMRYFEGSPYITEAVMDKFIWSLTDHAEYIMGVWDTFNLMSNWGVLANHGLYVAGCHLPDSERVAQYRATALERLERNRRIQVYRDGVHWEQSPMYHNEVMRCYLDVVLLARRRGEALPQGMEQAVYAMARTDLAWQKPDGREPMMGDSDDIDQRDLVTLAAAIFRDGEMKAAGYPRLDLDGVWELGAGEGARYEAMPAQVPAQTDFALTDSGNYVFRSGWGPEDTWARFHCGLLGAGHGHADQLHFDLSAFGEDVLTDSGRHTYVFGPSRREFKDVSGHNTVAVEGVPLYDCKDSWECGHLSRAVNRNFYSDSRYGYAEGGHLGWYAQGVFVNRRLIFLKPDVVVAVDEFYAGGSHTYRQFFHWGETGTLAAQENGFIWKGQSCTAQMRQVSAATAEASLKRGRVARHYNQAEENDVLETAVQGQGFVSVWSVLALDRAGKPEPLCVEKLPVTSNFKDIRFEDREIEALRIRKGERRWVVVVSHMEYASPTDTFNAGGCCGFGGVEVFDEAAGEEIGTVLAR